MRFAAGAVRRPKCGHGASQWSSSEGGERHVAHMKRNRSNDPSAADESAPVPVAVVTSRTEAELIVGMLRSNGLRAATSGHDAGGRQPELQLQGVQVLVTRSDEAASRELLAAIEDTPS